jgi:alanine transaminase
MEGVVHFAAKHGLVLIADEVYQTNVWDPSKQFTSFKRVAAEAGLVDPVGDPYGGGLQLASMHSTSKGFVGECGRRGGYLELCGFSEEVRGELYKLASLQLCSNTPGQVMTGLQCQPPRPGDPSHALYVEERDAILASLSRRAAKLNAAVNTMEGASCQPAEGAMYAFPQITLPPKALAAAAAAGGRAGDVFYCLELLDSTGIVVVPGSGFGQRQGTLHFRSTILPPEKDLDQVIEKLLQFHQGFMDKYR